MQTRNKNARNCSRSAKNLQTRNTHHPLRDRTETLTPSPWQTGVTHPFPQRFSGQGLILCLGPCPHFGLPDTSNGQGPHHEIRPCPSEGVLFTPSPYHNVSNLISSIDLEQKTPKMLQVVAGNGLRLQGGCGWWATLPVEAGPAATAAPAAGSNIPEGLSSPAALAQRQKMPGRDRA